jgi:D-threo-aldose 1-dehydrogenase
MKSVEFFPWAGASSALGFGTTSFMSADTTVERLALLQCAIDAGITHFDTAAYYGYGEAERLLGQALQGRRDRFTITTKFGMEASAVVKARWVNLVARRVLVLLPFLRKAAGQARGALSAKGLFEPDKARASLERSLQALRTDYVDLFLLHEPQLTDASSAPLLSFLDEEVSRGRIRAYGCGGQWPRIREISATGLSSAGWLQFEDNPIFRHLEVAKSSGAKCITFAPFNTALPVLIDWLDQHPEQRRAWSDELGVNCADKGNLAMLLQAGSHARNSDGIVLFSSKNSQRIKQAARVASGEVFTNEQVARFLELTGQVAEDAARSESRA